MDNNIAGLNNRVHKLEGICKKVSEALSKTVGIRDIYDIKKEFDHEFIFIKEKIMETEKEIKNINYILNPQNGTKGLVKDSTENSLKITGIEDTIKIHLDKHNKNIGIFLLILFSCLSLIGNIVGFIYQFLSK